MNNLTGYDLSRNWFDFCFENPDLIKPNHSALYFFCIEHCNRLGWKEKFGLPTTMAKEAIGIRSYNTYKKTLDSLDEWGFIKIIERSKNQYSSNIIAISNFNKANNKALDKALDKALIKHRSKQSESTDQSIDSINKQETIKQLNKEPINNKVEIWPTFDDFWHEYDKKVGNKEKIEKKWSKLSQSVKEQIMAYLPNYKISQPEKKFRKNPETFLNNNGWEDELIISDEKVKKQIDQFKRAEQNSQGWDYK